jgi:uncharacterized membrane protein (UPF0182 family)
MEVTLDTALSKIFGVIVSSPAAETARPPVPAAQAPATLAARDDLMAVIREANQHYERAQQLLRQGDWSGYGEEMKKLGEALKRMSAPK